MSNITTVTRPYAKAVLSIACNENTKEQWSQMLAMLACIARDPIGKKMLSNLALSPQDKVNFIESVLADRLTAQAQNLVKVLAKAKRLLILPQLQELYETMLCKLENVVMVDLTMAKPVDNTEVAVIQEICQKNLQGKVILTTNVDEELIGGGAAQIGNRVIDASIFGRLMAMRNLLRN